MKCLRWRSNRHRIYLLVACGALFLLNRHLTQEESRIDEEDEELTQVDVNEDDKVILFVEKVSGVGGFL